jgi:bacterioferritin
MAVPGAPHPRVLGYLGRALSLELTAVQQYMTQASLLELWGDGEAADHFRHETVEEMKHAERIVKRMLTSGVAPAASQLRPVSHASDLAELLRRNAVLEDDLIALYAEATRFCAQIGDADHQDFFQDLWQEEQQHRQVLTTWLARLQGPVSDLPARAQF